MSAASWQGEVGRPCVRAAQLLARSQGHPEALPPLLLLRLTVPLVLLLLPPPLHPPTAEELQELPAPGRAAGRRRSSSWIGAWPLLGVLPLVLLRILLMVLPGDGATLGVGEAGPLLRQALLLRAAPQLAQRARQLPGPVPGACRSLVAPQEVPWAMVQARQAVHWQLQCPAPAPPPLLHSPSSSSSRRAALGSQAAACPA